MLRNDPMPFSQGRGDLTAQQTGRLIRLLETSAMSGVHL